MRNLKKTTFKITTFPEDDAIIIRTGEGQFDHGKEPDEDRHIGYDAEGNMLWASFLNVSEGVDLDMFDDQQRAEIEGELEKLDIRTFA